MMSARGQLPAISVLMPVYNGEKFLRGAIDSILRQTFVDFEFIIVDDGSTDTTPVILQEYAQKDSRIRVMTNETNCKIAASLNRGLVAARAPLIARMDADDWSYPERLEKQEMFMKNHPEVSVLGSSVALAGKQGSYKTFASNEEIRAYMLFGNPMFHPTVMMRKDIVLAAGGYSTENIPVEDYALWVHLSNNQNVRFYNFKHPLVVYRESMGNYSSAYRTAQIYKTSEIAMKIVGELCSKQDSIDEESHIFLCGLRERKNLGGMRIAAWCDKLQHLNRQCQLFDQDALRQVCSDLLEQRVVKFLDVPSSFKRFIPTWCKQLGKKVLSRLMFH